MFWLFDGKIRESLWENVWVTLTGSVSKEWDTSRAAITNHHLPFSLFFYFTWGLATSSEAPGQLPNAWRWLSLAPAHVPGGNHHHPHHLHFPWGAALLVRLVQPEFRREMGNANKHIIFWNAYWKLSILCTSVSRWMGTEPPQALW